MWPPLAVNSDTLSVGRVKPKSGIKRGDNMVQSGLCKPQRLRAFSLISCAFLFTVAPPPATAQFKVWVMAKLPDTPEGLGVDSHGNLYATLMHIGEVVMLKDDGSYDHIAWVPSKEESGKGDLI